MKTYQELFEREKENKMICPHCKKPLDKKIPQKVREKAIALYKKGYSCRDIESLLEFRLSFSSVSRIVSKYLKDSGFKDVL